MIITLKNRDSNLFKLLLSSALILLMLIASCRKDPQISGSTERDILEKYLNLPEQAYNYSNPDLPAHFKDQFITVQDNTPADNPTTDWGATLGRVLFYDTRFSINSTISCATCHQQKFGFTDTAVFSKGFGGGLTKRHSMSLNNAIYYASGRFFWDERAASLEEQVLMPIQDAVEMGMHLDTLVNRLRQTEFYPILFKYTFGSEEINSDKIAKALAQFVRSMVSYRSKYDYGRQMVSTKIDDFPNFTVEENLGKNIFMSHTKINCAGCHTTDAFIMDNPRNNGLSINNDDIGVQVYTGNALDAGKFKSPSLKNVALRINFMHDGSIRGLDNVILHYDNGLKPNPNLDSHLIDQNTGSPLTMNLSQAERDALKAFLETLTDHELIKDVKFSSPFK